MKRPGHKHEPGCWRSRRPAGQGAGAFTIIEIMLAIAIFAGVLASIYSTWSAVLRSSKLGQTAAAEAQRKRIALRALEEALSSVEFFQANTPYYSFLADTKGDFASLSFVARLPVSFPGSGLFPGQPMRRVSFQVENGPNSIPQLVLRQSALLEPPDPKVEPYKIVLAPQINIFQAEFWDMQKQDWVQEWLNTNLPPRMVRVSIGFAGAEGGRSAVDQTVASRVVLLQGVPVPRAFQVPLRAAGAPFINPGVPAVPRTTPRPRTY